MTDAPRGEWNDRAPRQRVMKFASLRWPKDEDVVSLQDISRSGVRLLVPRDNKGSLSDAVYQVELVLRLQSGTRRLDITLARVCGADEKHLDLAFRFVSEQLTDEELSTLSNVFFGR